MKGSHGATGSPKVEERQLATTTMMVMEVVDVGCVEVDVDVVDVVVAVVFDGQIVLLVLQA